MNVGQNERMYWIGEKPSEVYFSGNTVTSDTLDGGSATFAVFTTAAMQARGLGYIIRWRSRGWKRNQEINGGTDTKGPWRTPASTWSSNTDGMSGDPYFYQAWILVRLGCGSNVSDFKIIENGYSSWNEWVQFRNTMPPNGCFRFYYRAEVEYRYILIQDASTIGAAKEFDYVTVSSPVVDLLILKSHANSYGGTTQQIRELINIRLSPTRTCQTPSVEEGTVHFGMVNQSDFPNNQWGAASGADRDFTLTFRNCPRINLKYYVHANGNKWVDSARGVVGVQDSVPGAANPIAGNPRGFAIQLQHRPGNHQPSENVYIHPNEVTQPLALESSGNNRQAYQRNYTGAGAAVNVTHIIPLRARLVRTAHSSQQQIQTGPFTSSVIVVIVYP